jgi:hypothetical protein
LFVLDGLDGLQDAEDDINPKQHHSLKDAIAYVTPRSSRPRGRFSSFSTLPPSPGSSEFLLDGTPYSFASSSMCSTRTSTPRHSSSPLARCHER